MAAPSTPDPFPTMEDIVGLPSWYNLAKIIAAFLALIAIILLAVSNLITARNAEDALAVARQIERSSECRYDKTADISDDNDNLDLWTWFGLVAVANEDNSELQRVIKEGNIAAEELRNSIHSRSQIVEECSALSK